jgi:alanyl-tRNA synthetase
MATLMKETMAKLGGRGGGSKDMAQGGVPTAEGIEAALSNVAALI